MPLRIPVTSSFPGPSWGIAVASGPDVDGMGRGAGAGGVAGEGDASGVAAVDVPSAGVDADAT